MASEQVRYFICFCGIYAFCSSIIQRVISSTVIYLTLSNIPEPSSVVCVKTAIVYHIVELSLVLASALLLLC